LNGLGYIISFDDDLEPEKLIIAQWRDALIVRKRIGQTDGYSEIGAAHVFENGVTSEVSISLSTNGTNIYVDGNLKESHPNFSYKNIENLLHGRLLVGNSAYGKSPWAGEINQIVICKGEYTFKEKISGEDVSLSNGFDTAINEDSLIAYYGFEEQTGQFAYNRAFDNNHLFIPLVFTPLKKIYLINPFWDIRYNAAFYFDVFINILLFVPLSVLAALIFLRITTLNKLYIYVLTVISCTLMSLIIEFIQVFIPQRSSSILDLGLNILGAVIGIFLLRYILLLFPTIKLKSQS
jgi:VanZ family protein